MFFVCVYVCVFLCAHVYVYVYVVYLCVCMCVCCACLFVCPGMEGLERQILGVFCLPLLLFILFFVTESLTEPGARCLYQIGRLVTSQVPTCLYPPVLRLELCATTPGFNMGARDPNSGPHAGKASTLPTKSPSQPRELFLMSYKLTLHQVHSQNCRKQKALETS